MQEDFRPAWKHFTTYQSLAPARPSATTSANLALHHKLTLDLLRHAQSIKDTMRGKRIQAALSEPILEILLNSAFQNEVALLHLVKHFTGRERATSLL